MQVITKDKVKRTVRQHYASVAASQKWCCGGAAVPRAARLGYSPEEVASLPEGADMGLGSGNPLQIAALRPGQTVLDLGSGGGIDCFLAAHRVGPTGRVVGVDMTPEMVERARANAEKNGYKNVEFRVGEIENLPVENASVDVVISNCVVNLSPDKPRVLREAFRVLKPGGRLAISDIVTTGPLPAPLRDDQELYCSCVSGAAEVDELENMLRAAGFVGIKISASGLGAETEHEIKKTFKHGLPIVSALIEARKPESVTRTRPPTMARRIWSHNTASDLPPPRGVLSFRL